jgi:hypothetical protein
MLCVGVGGVAGGAVVSALVELGGAGSEGVKTQRCRRRSCSGLQLTLQRFRVVRLALLDD